MLDDELQSRSARQPKAESAVLQDHQEQARGRRRRRGDHRRHTELERDVGHGHRLRQRGDNDARPSRGGHIRREHRHDDNGSARRARHVRRKLRVHVDNLCDVRRHRRVHPRLCQKGPYAQDRRHNGRLRHAVRRAFHDERLDEKLFRNGVGARVPRDV